MGAGRLTIHLDAIVDNWRRLDAASGIETRTGAVVKADGYGLGAGPVARALVRAGVRDFFVALAGEGAALREATGPGPRIFVFSGYMAEDRDAIAEHALIPILNSALQIADFAQALPGHACGLQLDTGMNRLGMEPDELSANLSAIRALQPGLVISHLACADTPDHPMNRTQLENFIQMTASLPGVPRSLAATGGILLGPEWHFDMTRPGVGLYGGLPFSGAHPVVTLDVPVIQCRDVAPGEPVGYGNDWIAAGATRVATISAGYADGLFRALMDGTAHAFAGDIACPVVGRISMDLITVDVTACGTDPAHLTLLGPHQGIDVLGAAAGTIGYEVLTGLGPRYDRRYVGQP